MTKNELAHEIVKTTGCDMKATVAIIESLMDTIKKSLADGENVYLRGFGTFELKHRAEKTARNISKNTTIIVPERNVPFFKPSKEFTSTISGLKD